MKPKRIIASLATSLSLVVTAQAAVTTNVLDWTFSTFAITNAPDAATSSNPSGGNPLATFFGNLNTYYFGTGPQGLFGPPTGLWDVEDGGHLTLSLNLAGQNQVVGYSVQIYQFADQSFYPGTLTLNPSGSFVSESVYVPQTGNMIGAWYIETFTWNSVVPSANLTLDISPGAGSSAMLLDEIKMTVMTDIPEPSSGLIAAAGLLAFGIRSWLRRKV
jgi:hypothetical protein